MPTIVVAAYLGTLLALATERAGSWVHGRFFPSTPPPPTLPAAALSARYGYADL